MIYGPYTSGWRQENDRRNHKRRARFARLGLLITIIISLLFWLPALGIA